MAVRTTRPVFGIAETEAGIPYVRMTSSGEGDKLKMFGGGIGDITLHLKQDMPFRSAIEVVRFLNAVIVRISERD